MREREGMGGGANGEGEADSQMNREPDAGLDPRIPGSPPELSHPGAPFFYF